MRRHETEHIVNCGQSGGQDPRARWLLNVANNDPKGVRTNSRDIVGSGPDHEMKQI